MKECERIPKRVRYSGRLYDTGNSRNGELELWHSGKFIRTVRWSEVQKAKA